MPIPNHCFECDKPVSGDEWLCYNCQQKEIENNAKKRP